MDLVEDLEGSGEMEGMLEQVEECRKRWRFQFNEMRKVMVVRKEEGEQEVVAGSKGNEGDEGIQVLGGVVCCAVEWEGASRLVQIHIT